MEYFILTQDSRINGPRLPKELIDLVPRKITTTQKDKQVTEPLAFSLYDSQDWEYSAIIDRPVYLVNTGVKNILEKYDRNIKSTPVMFNDVEKMKQHLYWLTEIRAVDCVAEESVFNPDRTIRKLVLDKKKIRDIPVFRIGNILEEYVVVRLDVAESLLRREFYGIGLNLVLINELKE
jgi:hypothetical protein